MSPADPPGEPPSGGVPRADQTPSAASGPVARTKSTTTMLVEHPIYRFFSRWAFPLFILFVAFLGRNVLLPFVFAFLIAYILSPVVRWMSERKDGTRRMPRGLAIIICYIVFIAGVVGFLFLLVPRLSSDIARLGKEAPQLIEKADKHYLPDLAHWLEKRFKPAQDVADTKPNDVVSDVPLPPGTAFKMTPLPDGSYALQIAPNGIDIKPGPEGSFSLKTNDTAPEPANMEDKLRSYMSKAIEGLRSKVQDVVRFGQTLVAGFIRGIFLFFFTLMIGAFILIDMEQVHGFLRSLFPANTRDDYDVIIAGIDRGLSGVIRGQLVICLINGVLTYIGLLVFSVKYSLILAMVAAMLTLIPIFGSILSSLPIVLVALVSGNEGVDIVRGLAIGLWILGIHFIEANVLNPKIIGAAAKIHPVLVIFALFLGEHTFGLVGALLAVPLLSAIQVLFMFFYRKTWKDAARGVSGPIRTETGPTPRGTT
ncbi:MAG TPA: AI-2E family transporter [Kofleriaceae bacterium]|jgi:predicted PurR-regulated permease PerM